MAARATPQRSRPASSATRLRCGTRCRACSRCSSTRNSSDARRWHRFRYLLFAGEVFPIKQLRRLRELLPGRARGSTTSTGRPRRTCARSIGWKRSIRRARFPCRFRASDHRCTRSSRRCEWRAAPEGELGELIVEGPCVTPGDSRRPNDPNTENHRCNRDATGDVVGYEGNELVLIAVARIGW